MDMALFGIIAADLDTTSRIATLFLYKLHPGAEYIIEMSEDCLS